MEKDGYKCIFRRQLKGKDVTVMQPSQCQTILNAKEKIKIKCKILLFLIMICFQLLIDKFEMLYIF